MFDVITKGEYWRWLDEGYSKPRSSSLKDIQDAYALSLLTPLRGARILEIGGGDARVLRMLTQHNECWLLDKFNASHGGPAAAPKIENARVVIGYMGEFLATLPENYFDVVFSISVIEHVPSGALRDCFADMVRVTSPGGLIFHAIDVYLSDEAGDDAFFKSQSERIKQYRGVVDQLGQRVQWRNAPAVDGSVTHSSRHATNGVDILYGWNRIAPQLREERARRSSCSLKFEMIRSK